MIVYSDPVSDIVRSVAIVRHEILVAGGIAVLLALVGGYFVARALSQRVKRLELAAEKVAAGDFDHPIAVDSTDELGQLAIAFNEMQRQLGQLEETRKKFIATASHELRTPIFSLGGFVELLEDDDLDPETRRRFLDQVSEQVERLRKLSVDLLDLSRLESGSLELRPEQVDLGELTRSVSGEFEPTLAQHDSHLELRLPSRTIEAVCDPVRVAQIMRILIDNALTHTSSGTRIVVTAGREDGTVRLVVRDDGEGIDPESLSRIFEPFYTADDAQGSGLGLAIASELAERMDGRLSVVSGIGRHGVHAGAAGPWPRAGRARAQQPAVAAAGPGMSARSAAAMTTTTGPELVLELGQRAARARAARAGLARRARPRGRRAPAATSRSRSTRSPRSCSRSSWPSGRRGWRSSPRTAAWWRRPTPPTCWSSTRSTAPARRWPGWSRRAWRSRWRRCDDGEPTMADVRLGLRGRDQDRRLVPGREGRRRPQHAAGRAEPDDRRAADVLGLRVPRAAGARRRSRCWPS